MLLKKKKKKIITIINDEYNKNNVYNIFTEMILQGRGKSKQTIIIDTLLIKNY